jgi:hypothetical protein
MGTKRSHNKHRAGGSRVSKGLTARQRALKLHAISNRGPQLDSDGIVRLHGDVSIDSKEMSAWEPSRITAFFDGLAKSITAASDAERKK